MQKPKYDKLCSFYALGKCNKGDDCPFVHSEVEKVDLERNQEGRLIKKTTSNSFSKGRGRNYNYQNNNEEENQDHQLTTKNNKTQERNTTSYQNKQYQPSFNQNSRNTSNNSRRVNESFTKFQNNKISSESINQKTNNVDSDRWEKHTDQNNDQSYKPRGRGRGINDRNQNRERFNKDNNDKYSSEKQNEISNDWKINEQDPSDFKIKKVKINEIKQKKDVFKLEQVYNIPKLIQIIGFLNEFLGILTEESIEFYQIPFKRQSLDLIEQQKCVKLQGYDKIFTKGWMQELDQNQYSLMVEFKEEESQMKNLIVYDNVFKHQQYYLVKEISIKSIVYCYLEFNILYTFCSDGIIRLFELKPQYVTQYIQHYNIESAIDTVVKVGSNYVISVKCGKLYLFDGQHAREIPFQIDCKCSQMILDYNRVILKYENEEQTLIYLLQQSLQVIGPIYKCQKTIGLELIKNYENEQLFILANDKNIIVLQEMEQKLHIIHSFDSQLSSLKKIEITNQNMVTQKYIVGIQRENLKFYSIVPEQ